MKTLLFVYNANSGTVNNWLDIAHKIVSPQTYACELCSLTHNGFREKRAWKNFKNQNNIEMDFYYKDEFVQKFRSKWLPAYEFPVILLASHGNLEPFILPAELRNIETVEDLILRIETLIAQD